MVTDRDDFPLTWRERLEELGGRRRELWPLALLVVSVVAGSLFLWARGAPAAIAPPATPVSNPASPGPAPSPMVLVHVAGAVRSPGLYELPAGARVADAIAAAGGASPRARIDLLNLAAVVADGIKIEVPTQRRAGVPGVVATPAPTAPAPVSLNAADAAALEAIPGIGPARAEAILTYRAEIGSFDTVEQLLEVPGIGPAILESIRPYVIL